MNWFKQTLANVAGTQEPEYGPAAIQSVAAQAQSVPFTELTKDDLKWKVMESTCVETQTFYFHTDDGVLAMVQVVYSNVGGLRTMSQLNLKIFHHGGPFQHLWCSDSLDHYSFDDEHYCFYADNLAVELNDTGDSFTIKSAVNEESIINIKLTRAVPGLQVGTNGTSYFGEDPAHPWGSMRHAFWPRCNAEGTVVTKEKKYDMQGKALFVYALQGMKPHHAAARWNFVSLHTQSYSALMMEFTTPVSYGNTVVNVSALVKDGEIIAAGASGSLKHIAANKDTDNDWPEPKTISVEWRGESKGGQAVAADVTGDLGRKLDRVDVLAHVPGFVKSIVGGVVGTKPFIYQYSPADRLRLKVKTGSDEVEEEGHLLYEATFIS